MTPQQTREKIDLDRLTISDEELVARRLRVTPLLLRESELHRFDAPETIKEMRNTAYTWEPKNLVPLQPMEREDSYVEIARGSTHHECAYYGFFKPSLAEVYAQMPDDPRITAFYLDSNSVAILDNGAGHIANVYWLSNKPRVWNAAEGRFE